MSTSLVAFAVGDFANKSYTRGHFFIHPSEIESIDYAVSIAESAIPSMEHWIEMPLPLKKLDMITMPHTSSEALENWGLILLSKRLALYEEKATLRYEKESIFLTVIHEIVHQWFGNLVSPAWWNDLWLSEGISMLLHYKIGDKVNS